MRRTFRKLNAQLHASASPKGGNLENQSPTMQPPSSADITRYSYQHGTNIGSIFILEKWLTPSMFPESAKGTSELVSVESWVNYEGISKAKERFEKHWRDYVSDADLDWLRDTAKCTTVRLPMGYFTLGPAYCQNTPFQKVSEVYQNAWNAVQTLVSRCNQRGIGVLLDMHGLPGGANNQDHSGTNSGKAEMWTSQAYRDLAAKCLCFIAQQAKSMEGVTGIQIANEVDRDVSIMYTWYNRVLAEVARIDPTMPIYISDGWDLNTAIKYVQGKNTLRAGIRNPVIIDTHLYWCFSDADKQKSVQQITSEVPSSLSQLEGKDGNVVERGAVQAFVGEYSCVLDEKSWSRSSGTTRDQLIRSFGDAECKRWQQRAGGSTFWTYRMDWMPGGEWGFKQMNEQRSITAPASLALAVPDVRNRVNSARSQQTQRKQMASQTHSRYWDTNHPAQYEHWRFEYGWDLGFADALAFFESRSQRGLCGGDKIGLLDSWCLKRLRESDQSSKYLWEFEQGLRQGVKECYECVGV